MSGFMGKTQTQENVPGDVKGLRAGASQFLQGQMGGLNVGAPDISAYEKMFAQRNELGLAGAKEAAGNLTGSGFAAALGNYAGRAATEQGGFLAQLLEASKQNNANRLAGLVSTFGTAGVAPPSQTYQPGFLDYLTQAGSQVAGAAGAAGGFGNLFGGGKKKATPSYISPSAYDNYYGEG